MSDLKYYKNGKWNIVNGQITGDTLPIGAIVPFGGWDAPTGWLICDGTLLNKTDYPELYNAIGYSFGGEEGGSTFGLPDLRGRVPLGLKETDTDFNGMGLTGGNKTHTQTTDEVAPHTHQLWIEGDQSGSTYGLPQSALYWDKAKNNWANGQFGVNRTNPNTAQPMNIMNPYQTVNYIIKATQSAGLVANVSNIQSDSTTDTYSCDYINGLIDGVVEQGRNANGDYIKFANGMLICSSYFGPVETQAGQGAQRVVNFPSQFVNDQYSCNISIITGQAYWADLAYCVNGKTKYGFTLQTWNRGGSTNTGQWFNYIAVGRWK